MKTVIHNVGFFWVRSNTSCVILQGRKENCYNLFLLLLILHSHPWLPLRISNCFTACVYNTKGLPTWLSGKEPTCHCRRCQFDPWVRKMPWRRKWQLHSNILAWKSPWTEEPGGLQSMGWQNGTRLGNRAHTHKTMLGAAFLEPWCRRCHAHRWPPSITAPGGTWP